MSTTRRAQRAAGIAIAALGLYWFLYELTDEKAAARSLGIELGPRADHLFAAIALGTLGAWIAWRAHTRPD